MEYVKEKQSVQIITRIFVDDLERLIRTRYDETVTLAAKSESKNVDQYIEKYLGEKMAITINGKHTNMVFLGKEYENDIVYCYLEIKNVASIQSFEISNHVLFDLFSDQKNIVRTNINDENNSFILIKQNDKGMLNFK
ncbi:peptidase E [Bizionia algoritergicola]|uniref:Peptidase E n=1 Tax=Bizionia algoritergicola TaxID=291187 RepID=A0A5D0QVW4_9FLAO|nr:peptidase E [Bizionia algoritergicola]